MRLVQANVAVSKRRWFKDILHVGKLQHVYHRQGRNFALKTFLNYLIDEARSLKSVTASFSHIFTGPVASRKLAALFCKVYIRERLTLTYQMKRWEDEENPEAFARFVKRVRGRKGWVCTYKSTERSYITYRDILELQPANGGNDSSRHLTF